MMFKMDKNLAMRGISIFLFSVLTILGIGFSIYLMVVTNTILSRVVALAFLILSAVSGFFNTFTSYSYYRSYLYDKHLEKIQKKLKPMKGFPLVAVAVPVYNEDTAMTERNFLRLMEVDYPKDRVNFYLLDDSTDPAIRKELERFSRKHNVRYIHRDDRRNFKAGALNNFAMNAKEEFLAIFDYDEYLVDTRFILDLLPYFNNKKLSYAQTEKRFQKGTFFSDTVDIFHGFFFKFIQPSRALNNTGIFAGSCGIIRTSYLKKIGGFPEYVTEDTFFSFESDANGYESIYIPRHYALGAPITKFSHLAKQQWRYNYGDTQFLGYFVGKLLGKSNKKPKSKWLLVDYVTHGFGLNYISVVLIIFTIVSVAIVFSGLTVVPNMIIPGGFLLGSPEMIFETLGVLAFVLSLMAPVIVTKLYFGSLKKGFMMLLLNFALAFIRAKAALFAVFSKTVKNSWTGISFLKSEKNIIFALKNSIVETAFSGILFLLGIVAVMINNLYGGLWLIGYGIFYISTAYMFYRYR